MLPCNESKKLDFQRNDLAQIWAMTSRHLIIGGLVAEKKLRVSLKKIKKLLNSDLKSLNEWLKTNMISLNAGKTEILIFRHHKKPLNYDLEIKLDGKRL